MSQRFPWRNYFEKDGLPSPVVNCIFQDSRGYLWLGTENGLSRFDGMEFKTYKKDDGLSDNRIKAIGEDRGGNLWIGTESGCDLFSSANGPTGYSFRNILSNGGVNSIAKDNEGKLWLGTSDGIHCVNGKTSRRFSLPGSHYIERIRAVAVDKKGKLWLGTDKGLYSYETKNFPPCPIDSYTTNNGLLDNVVYALGYDSRGNLWIGTRNGLNRFKEGKLTSYTIKDGLINNSITAINEDSGGNIWIGTWNGVSLFSRGKFVNYSTINGLPNNFIYSITEDREGNIWLGTHSGASCLTSLNIKAYSKEDGLPNEMIIDIIQDKKGRFWFGTSEGLSCYDGDKFKTYTTQNGLVSNAVNQLMEDRQGNIWITTPQGLSILSAGSFTNYTVKDGLPDNILFDLVESRDGTTWIGSGKGIIHCKNGKFSTPTFNREQFAVFYIIEDSRGILWFSSRHNLYRYSKKHLTSISTQYNFTGKDINTIFEDSKGKIWICSVGGLTCFDKEIFTQYSQGNSDLPDNACYCIVEDTHGNLWIGHTRGITCFNGREFKTYTSERLELTGRSWFKGIMDNNDCLWFGTSEGVVSFFPPPVRLNTTPPPVYYTGLKVMEKEIPLAESTTFTYDRNIFRFNYIGLSFTDPGGVSYKYRLENIDEDWQTTKDRSLFYPFLPPGSYTLKVKAVNSDGIESEKPAEYRFKILPPFWQTWWFQVFMGVLLAGFLFLALHWHVKRTREKAELKARKAEIEARNRQLVISQRMELMGTLAAGTVHDLKNLLAVIIGYSRLMSPKYRGDSEDHQNIEMIKETAATAAQMAKQILSFARQKNTALDPVELRTVLLEILDTLKVIQPKNIQVVQDIQAEPIFFPIQPARFQQVVMNLCLNAFQAMPDGGQLKISLSSTVNTDITLQISDTGSTGIKKDHLEKLFDPFFTTKEQEQGSGLGLFVVKQIVEEYQGKIDVRSEPGQGTSFVIKFNCYLASGSQGTFLEKGPLDPPKTSGKVN